MKLRQLIGLVVTCGSLLFVAACGDDNDTFTPPTPIPTATAPPPTNTRTVTSTPTTSGPTATPTITNTPGTPTITDTPGREPTCGNNVVEAGEDCDGGNDVGGDGCAANCTNEREVSCVFGGSTGASVQTGFFALPLTFTGAQTLTAGDPRDSAVTTSTGKTFNAGDIPIVIKEENLNFDPVSVPGLVCACVRAVADPELGAGNAGSGTVGCGPSGLTPVDVQTVVDRNITDVDPTCATGMPDSMNPAICNGKPVVTLSGTGPRGSAVIETSTSITTISDQGTCARQCIPGNGPDCLPCTDDDPDQVEASTVVTTTGTARARLEDVNNQIGKAIDCDQQCPAGGPNCICMATGTGVPDCDLLDSNPNQGIVGVKLVGAFAQINAPQTGDIVVATSFECVAP